MNRLAFIGVFALLCAVLTGCHDNDPDYTKVTPPEVAVAPNTLSGLITDMQGNAIAGATVKFGEASATTDNNGIYTFDNVTAGAYTITASANGMNPVSDNLVVEKKAVTQNLVWNAILAKLVVSEINVTVDGGGEGEVESDAIKGNDEGKVDITVEIPANVVPEDTKIYLTPIYTEESAAVTKASTTDDELLIGATLSCSDNDLVLSHDIDVTFKLDESLVSNVETKKFVDGKWVDVPSAVVDGDVVISTREFTSYGIFLKVTVNETVSTEALVFSQSEWNNLYGNANVYVKEATFTYKTGAEINSTATNKLEGLLIEYLARLHGITVKTLNGTYPIDVTLPIGTGLSIKGAQEKTTVTVSGNGKSVKGTTYGTSSVQVTTYSRGDHNGGTN